MGCGSEEGSYLGLMDLCITQLSLLPPPSSLLPPSSSLLTPPPSFPGVSLSRVFAQVGDVEHAFPGQRGRQVDRRHILRMGLTPQSSHHVTLGIVLL